MMFSGVFGQLLMVRISPGGNGVVHVLLVTLKKLTISFMYASCERKTEPSRKYWKRMQSQ